MPHSLPSFRKIGTQHFQHFLIFISHFLSKFLSRTTTYRWFKPLNSGISYAPSTFLQRRIRLEVVDDVVKIEVKSHVASQNILLSFLIEGPKVFWGRLQEFCQLAYTTTCPPTMIAIGCTL